MSSSLMKKNILVIEPKNENDISISDSLCSFFRNHPFGHIYHCDNSEFDSDLFKKKNYSMVIVVIYDNNAHKIYELLDQIRKCDQAVPIVLISYSQKFVLNSELIAFGIEDIINRGLQHRYLNKKEVDHNYIGYKILLIFSRAKKCKDCFFMVKDMRKKYDGYINKICMLMDEVKKNTVSIDKPT